MLEHKKVLSSELSEKLFKNRVPLSGGIELTSRCNFRCIHCYETVERDNISAVFETEKLLKVIDDFISMGLMSVYLTGGEAMLRPDFEYIYKYIRERGVLVGVLTNATTLTEDRCELFKEYMPTMIDISMYGASEKVYQKVTKKEGMFKKFINGLELLKKYNIPFELKTVLMNENVSELDDMKKIADYYRVPFKFFSYIRPYNNGNVEPQNHMLAIDDILQIEIEDCAICEYYIGKNKNTLSERQKQKKKYLCRIAQNGFFITYDGFLNGCVRTRNNGYDLRQGSAKEGWEYLYECYVKPSEEKDFMCSTCDIINFCDFCPGEFEIETGSPIIPSKNICELAHKRAKYFIKK